MTTMEAQLSGSTIGNASVLALGRDMAAQMPVWSDDQALETLAEVANETALADRISSIAPELLVAVLRSGAGLPASDQSKAVAEWIKANAGLWRNVLSPEATSRRSVILDFGGHQSAIALASAQQDREAAQHLYDAMMVSSGAELAIGSWMEHRSVYATDNYRSLLLPGARRDHHLGYDLFAPAQTPIYMPMAGQIVQSGIIDERLDYGGFLVTRHDFAPDHRFFALWGHLSHASISNRSPGQTLQQGEILARMGDFEENGWWLPHVHLQLSTLQFADFRQMPGVGEGECRNLWAEIFPDPSVLVMGRSSRP